MESKALSVGQISKNFELKNVWSMTCNGSTYAPPVKVVTPYPAPPPQVLKFLIPTLVLKRFTPPSNWKWLFLHFLHMATSNKHMFIFLQRAIITN